MKTENVSHGFIVRNILLNETFNQFKIYYLFYMDLSNDLTEFDYIDNFVMLERDYNIFYKTNINSIMNN